ncbi:UNVERIFIED_CONTAM: Regulatory-associated protein of TOR 1, partial [Sesamum angustifolium]
MALGDLMAASRFSQSSGAVLNHLEQVSANGNYVQEDGERSAYSVNDVYDDTNARDLSETASSSYVAMTTTTSMAYLPQTVVLCELRHDGYEESVPSGPSDSGLVSKWRPRER